MVLTGTQQSKYDKTSETFELCDDYIRKKYAGRSGHNNHLQATKEREMENKIKILRSHCGSIYFGY